MHLSPEEGRVVGSLIEKQLTTPQQYPLTINALVSACNQSSNRDPVVSYEDGVVEIAVSALKQEGLLGFVYPSHGRSVTRYRHALAERLGLDDRELALLALLLLRGPQTAGELRGRSERMAQFDGIAAVEADLVRLSDRAQPLVVRLPRRPGQKEERWAEILTTDSTPSSSSPSLSGVAAEAPVAGVPASSSPGRPTSLVEDIADLRQAVALLQAEMVAVRREAAALRADWAHLQEQLGG
jgi:uncharacterized protein YceH (UPF0502 family)